MKETAVAGKDGINSQKKRTDGEKNQRDERLMIMSD
jgi:hypothetical protein